MQHLYTYNLFTYLVYLYDYSDTLDIIYMIIFVANLPSSSCFSEDNVKHCISRTWWVIREIGLGFKIFFSSSRERWRWFRLEWLVLGMNYFRKWFKSLESDELERGMREKEESRIISQFLAWTTWRSRVVVREEKIEFCFGCADFEIPVWVWNFKRD